MRDIFICPDCGCKVTVGDKFCKNCSCKLSWDSAKEDDRNLIINNDTTELVNRDFQKCKKIKVWRIVFCIVAMIAWLSCGFCLRGVLSRGEVKSWKEKCSTLAEEKNKLKENNNLLKEECDSWADKYSTLEREFDNLVGDYDELQEEYNRVKLSQSKKQQTSDSKAENSAFETLYYTGTGNNVVKGISLPRGDYYITTTHEGSHNCFAHFFESVNSYGPLIANLVGNGSEVYAFSGTSSNGYINITADGKWSITIEKIQ